MLKVGLFHFSILWTLLLPFHVASGHDDSGLLFLENRGQWESEVRFRAKIPGGDLYVLKNKLKYVFYNSRYKNHEGIFEQEDAPFGKKAREENVYHAVDLSFEGSNISSSIGGKGKHRTVTNFFKGPEKNKWIRGVSTYARIEIRQLYDGIDFVMYHENGSLKYDFIVAPGANPDAIKLRYSGQSELKIRDGKVKIGTVHGELIENVPLSFSVSNSRKVSVPSEFVMEDGVVRFNFPSGYNTNARLIIDPELIFSTYSGSFADNWGFTATYDDEGNLYSGGIVFDAGYPATGGVFQPDHRGSWDVGILKYDPTGKDLLWATYLGGSFSETPQSIIVNSKGELIIYGTTSSPDFPTTDHAFQKSFLGGDPIYDTAFVAVPRLVGGIPMLNGTDIFLAILSKNGDSLVGSTFIGGSENDGIMEKFMPLTKNYGDQFRGEVIIDASDNIYVASNTSSADFLIKNGPVPDYGGGTNDGMVMKFNPDLSELFWSTFIGGNGMDALFSVKVDLDGNVFASGGSNSADFPVTEGAYKTEKPSSFDIDGVVVKISNDGTELLKSTYIGTSAYDQVYFLELDSSNQVYLLGQTQGNYPVTDGVYSNARGGQFIHKMNNDLDSTYFSTVIGSGSGSPDFSPTAFLVNECENIFISGWGGTLNHPSFGYIGGNTIGLPVTNNAFQNQTDGTDFYLVVLLQDAKQLLYGTYFGEISGRGEHVDGGTSRFDKKGIVYQSVCGGCGGSSGFPTYPPDVWSTTNNSSNCNNAAFKFDLASLIARFETDTEDFTNRGIRKGCHPLTLVFLNESIGGEDFLWEFGEGTITNREDSITITYDAPGSYPVVLTATDINTCVRESKATGVITVFDYDFNIMPDDSICYGESIVLKAGGGENYDWIPKNSLQNANTSTPVASPDSTTTYHVKIVDRNGCTGEDSLEIKVIPGITAGFKYEKTYDCHGTPTLEFTNTSENASAFVWDFGDGNSSDELDPTHRFEDSDSLKTYTITLKAGASFCTSSKSMEVTSVSTFVPNFISPNGDGKNDAFEITADDEIELYVYNRWGKKVYHAENYQNNWQPKNLASGVYFYEILFKDKNTRCNGWVQVMY
ncbi:MAG: gliding motility-associated C-terminal domain-containing protein [Cytophagales bacterium]|nr:gliding motility-associated C-terminal domain-containing protein [Cytophagales bacterium]